MKTTIMIAAEKLFEFTSFDQWVNKAQSWFRNHGVDSCDTLCIDATGRVITTGKGFQRARDEDAFPVGVYKVGEDVC